MKEGRELFSCQHKLKAIKASSIIATVRSQILCQLTAKMICGLKSLTFTNSELSECHKFESVAWYI